MLGMLRPDIARAIRESDESPTTIVDCFGRALRAKYRLTQIQAEKAKKKEVCRQQSKRKENPSTSKITHSQGKKKKLATATSCEKCGRNHIGECRYGTNKCFRCGQEGHQVRDCAHKRAEESGPSTRVDNAGTIVLLRLKQGFKFKILLLYKGVYFLRRMLCNRLSVIGRHVLFNVNSCARRSFSYVLLSVEIPMNRGV